MYLNDSKPETRVISGCGGGSGQGSRAVPAVGSWSFYHPSSGTPIGSNSAIQYVISCTKAPMLAVYRLYTGVTGWEITDLEMSL